jgi:hypothetical protein
MVETNATMTGPQVVGLQDHDRTQREDEEEDRISEIVADGPVPPGPRLVTSNSFNSASSRPRTGEIVESATSITGIQADSGMLGDQDHELTRESLGEQGIHGSEADIILVRRNEEEVLMQNFRMWIKCFSIVVCLLTPAMLGIMIWMMVEWMQHRRDECDVPLQMWCQVVSVIVIFNATVNRPSRHGSLIVRLFCAWEPDPSAQRRPPWRVRLYNAVVASFIFGWNVYGLSLIITSQSGPLGCSERATGLFAAVKVYVAVNLTFTVFFYVNMIGISRVLSLMMRRGMLHTSMAAPKGTLDNQTEDVPPNDKVLSDQATCSVCLEDFPASGEGVRRMKACGHIFHRQCLQNWLNTARTCPICRHDLVAGEAP